MSNLLNPLHTIIPIFVTNIEKYTLARLRIRARKKTQKCYSPGCENNAIKSHIQQAEGPLRLIASSGKVVQLEYNYFSSRYRFKKVGIKDRNGDVLTFWGFCEQCDTRIFFPIEQEGYDVYDYKNQLLHSYRGLLSELYKQDYNLKWYDLIFESNDLSEETKKRFRHTKIEQSIGAFFLKCFKELIENDIVNNTKNFEFIVLKLPAAQVCTSTVYSPPMPLIGVDDQFLNRVETSPSLKPPNTIVLVSLIPTKTSTFCILGQPVDTSLPDRINLNRITKYSPKEKIKFVSDVLIKRIESWCVSIDLYESWKKGNRDKQVIYEIQKYLPDHMKSQQIKFNLLKNF